MLANEFGMSRSVLSGSAAGQPVIAMSGVDPEPRKARGQELTLPSRHLTFRQACFGRPRSSSLTEQGFCSSSHRISFADRPFPDHFFGRQRSPAGRPHRVLGKMPVEGSFETLPLTLI